MSLLTHNRPLDARSILGPAAFRITWDSRENGRLDCQTARSFVFAIRQWRNLEPRPPLDCRVAPTGISKIRCSPRKPVPGRKCTAARKACVRVARKLVERPPACPLDQHKQLLDPFMLKRVPDAPREWTGASASVSDPFEEDQSHGRLRQLPLQSTFQSISLAVLCVSGEIVGCCHVSCWLLVN